MNQHSKCSPTVIDLLFRVFKKRYGSAWSLFHADHDLVKQKKLLWLDHLQAFSAGQIKKAMDSMRVKHAKTPPTLIEFERLCAAQRPSRHKRPTYQWLHHEKVKRASEATRDAEIEKIKQELANG